LIDTVNAVLLNDITLFSYELFPYYFVKKSNIISINLLFKIF
jgi:hypothetical protein